MRDPRLSRIRYAVACAFAILAIAASPALSHEATANSTYGNVNQFSLVVKANLPNGDQSTIVPQQPWSYNGRHTFGLTASQIMGADTLSETILGSGVLTHDGIVTPNPDDQFAFAFSVSDQDLEDGGMYTRMGRSTSQASAHTHFAPEPLALEAMM
jgi:hypothetical protein